MTSLRTETAISTQASEQGAGLTEPLFIQVGSRRYQVSGFEQASEMFCAARDANGEGASKTPEVMIVTADGRKVARISYNGRVWPAEEWRADMTPLFDNRAAQ